MNLLILGAGGLGCELLKNATMMVARKEIQLKKITIIDMDTIELTNLNRQFMFNDNDIGKYKAQVAAKYVDEKFTGVVKVEPLVTDLTTLSRDFYEQYQLIISGLDAIEPRRYINQMCIQIAQLSQFGNIIPLIDGGVESLKGHVKLIIPGVTACWECSISTLPNQDVMGSDGGNVPLCTIATNPRSLEHVIEFVYIKAMEGGLAKDWDQDATVVNQLLSQCQDRANEYNIDKDKLTISYMLGVMKKIIPNVSTANAMIAAQCCLELYKIYNDLIDFDSNPHNFLMINGNQGQFHYSFTYERDPQCPVCSVLF
ncbi:NEDD8-activating enzyme E1 catalytic subunit [Monosporozyma unispora]|nr:hypothetical protein C6P44_005108 [Kazachstania unispora]